MMRYNRGDSGLVDNQHLLRILRETTADAKHHRSCKSCKWKK
ncbi:hypothetical protein PM8797T_05735 [Gimesia maris DSM 8797]|nr:hypothetical protein PM8797T_05735 [Gimesia maris DSM 8797]